MRIFPFTSSMSKKPIFWVVGKLNNSSIQATITPAGMGQIHYDRTDGVYGKHVVDTLHQLGEDRLVSEFIKIAVTESVVITRTQQP